MGNFWISRITRPIYYTVLLYLVCIVQTGRLVKTMVGEDFSSTDLHLANGDTLLLGQVAELAQIDRSDAGRLHTRKLQAI